ncbi:MAG TPA: hypothetical protein VLT61_14885 [Anaeromyxobacteraceae bacterium]|nr:hypothetical protein [Anaeromyxobacteraceae bacterium]
MLAPLALASLLTAAPSGNARLDQGEVGVTLRLASFETDEVAVRRGRFTSAELLYRTPSGERLDLRFLFRGPGELPAKNVTSIVVQTAKGGLSSWTPTRRSGCRVKLLRATATELAGKIECPSPEAGAPFDAVFDAKK